MGTGPCASEVGSTTGVTVVADGADCVVYFKNVGSTTWEVPTTVGDVDVLLVGGGGGGGGTFDTIAAGGGGAGGMREWTGHTVTPGASLTVTVGAGGAGGAGATNAYGYAGATGGSSSFGSLSVSGGGGGGGGRTWGVAGGSGGGSGGRTATLLAGSGISGEGNAGGQANAAYFGGGGGGGKSAAGANSTSTAGGAGGAGAQSSIDTVSTVYATGGGGATHNTARNGSAGAANTGNGGDGAGCGSGCGRAGGAGGSGIVVVRYTPGSAPTTTTTTTTTAPADSTAPTLSSTSPVDGATSVSPVASLSLTFDENVSAVSGKEIILYTTIGSAEVERFSVTDTSRVTISGRVVTINPTASLQWSTIYFVRVDAGAFRDSAGNGFAGIWSQTDWNFTTAVDPSPTTTSPTATTTTTVTIAPQATSSPTTSVAASPGGGSTAASTATPSTVASTSSDAGSSTAPTTSVSATSTSTTTTTTIPEAPLATSAFIDEKGARVALVDGVPVEVSSTIEGKSVITRVGSASLILTATRSDGGTVLPNTNGALPMREGDTVTVVAEGFASFAPVDVWVYSDPVYLGRKEADGFGRATLVTSLPDLPPGEHDIVIDGESREGARITLATSLTVLDDLEEESVVRRVGTVAVWALLIGGLIAGLLVPGRIRRRPVD